MFERCGRCGEDIRDQSGLPHFGCWDSRASGDEIDAWVARVELNAGDEARRYLSRIGDPSAAEHLRRHLSSDSSVVLAAVITSLGWSGDASDGPSLIALTTHIDEKIRTTARESLTDLGIPGTADLLWDSFGELPADSAEAKRILDCLVWLRHDLALAVVRGLFDEYGLQPPPHGFDTMRALVRLGDETDRHGIVRAVTESLEIEASGGPQLTRNIPGEAWLRYFWVMNPIAPDEVIATRASLSPLAVKGLPWYLQRPQEEVADKASGTVPCRTIVGYHTTPQPGTGVVPAKFFGQPDWREGPAWPVGGDGQLLMFYGQLPIGDRTAYLFTGGPKEWEPLGPGSAMVMQPGNGCHLPTLDVDSGPQLYEFILEGERFIPRGRHLPQPERFVELADGFEPAKWPEDQVEFSTEWEKIGGTPVWLQGDEPPKGDGWAYAFQFSAGLAGSDRGDGAVFYGWVNDGGAGALGWAGS